MIPENDALYKALQLIEVNIHWRWSNHANFLSLIDGTGDYGSDLTIQRVFKRKIASVIIQVGYSDFDLTEEDVYKSFLRHYNVLTGKLTDMCREVSDVFEGKFKLTKDQILLLLDLTFLIPNHITRFSYKRTQGILKSIPKHKQELFRYHFMAFVKRAFETIGEKRLTKTLEFLNIPKSTWDDWRKNEVRNMKNITRFEQWKANTPESAIKELKPLLKKFLDYPDRTYHNLKKVPSCFKELAKHYSRKSTG